MTSNEQMLAQLRTLHADHVEQREAILKAVEAAGKTHLDVDETRSFRAHTTAIDELAERIADVQAEVDRSGADNPNLRRAVSGDAPDARSASRAWGRVAAQAVRRDLSGGESRAVISGSVDIPTLVVPQVVSIPHPARLIDLFTNRAPAESMSFVYCRQTARTNNAAPVADLAQKPTSVLTVQEVDDTCKVIAHLSEPLPYRIWIDEQQIAQWLTDEMAQGVLDQVEHQAISGDGTGLNMTGVLAATGTTAVPYTTDVATTLRSAVTALQNIGEQPTGWALNPADAQAIDLTRWGASGGLLTGGYENDTRSGFGTSDNIFGTTPRVISPTVPQGVAILGDWSQLKLFVHWDMSIMVNAFGDSLFGKNAVQVRAEMLVGVGVLRPKAFAVVDLTA